MSWLKKRAKEAAGCKQGAPDCECDFHDCPCEPCIALAIETVAREFAERALHCFVVQTGSRAPGYNHNKACGCQHCAARYKAAISEADKDGP